MSGVWVDIATVSANEIPYLPNAKLRQRAEIVARSLGGGHSTGGGHSRRVKWRTADSHHRRVVLYSIILVVIQSP